MEKKTVLGTLSAPDDPMRAKEHENIDQFLKQLHADYDPVYNMLMNYQCKDELDNDSGGAAKECCTPDFSCFVSLKVLAAPVLVLPYSCSR